jgi:hypothetical protein
MRPERKVLYDILMSASPQLGASMLIAQILDFIESTHVEHEQFTSWVCENKKELANVYKWENFYLGDFIDKGSVQSTKLTAQEEAEIERYTRDVEEYRKKQEQDRIEYDEKIKRIQEKANKEYQEKRQGNLITKQPTQQPINEDARKQELYNQINNL